MELPGADMVGLGLGHLARLHALGARGVSNETLHVGKARIQRRGVRCRRAGSHRRLRRRAEPVDQHQHGEQWQPSAAANRNQPHHGCLLVSFISV